MASPGPSVVASEPVCQCHSQAETPRCPLDQNQTRLAFLGPSCTLEIDVARVEELAATSVRCKICKDDLLATLHNLATTPGLCIPIELKVDEEADMYALRSEPGQARPKLVLSNIRDLKEIPQPPASFIMDHVYRFLYEQSGGGLFATGTSDDEIEGLVRGLNDLCAAGALRDDQALALAKQIEYLYDAILVGYFFFKLFRPQQAPTDLAFLVASHRRDQAEFFRHLIDHVRGCTSPAGHAWSLVLPKLVQCFKQSLLIFQHPQAWDALKFGVRLFSPSVANSFVLRHIGEVFPFAMLTEFFLSVRAGKAVTVAVAPLSKDVMMIVRAFLAAHDLSQLATDGEVLSGFSGRLLSKDKKTFVVPQDKLYSILKGESGQVVQWTLRNDVGDWFGVGSVQETVLDEAAQRFWETLVNEKKVQTQAALSTFLERAAQRGEEDAWTTVQEHLDALFSVKLGLHAFGELDFLLARCHMVRTCRYPWGTRAISRVLSHVISKVAPDHAVVRPINRTVNTGLMPARSRMGSGMDDSPTGAGPSATSSGLATSRLLRSRMGSGMDEPSPLSTSRGGRMNSAMDEHPRSAAARSAALRGSMGAEDTSPFLRPASVVGEVAHDGARQRVFFTGGAGIRSSADEYSMFDSLDDDDSSSYVSAPTRQLRHHSSASMTVGTDHRLSVSPPIRPLFMSAGAGGGGPFFSGQPVPLDMLPGVPQSMGQQFNNASGGGMFPQQPDMYNSNSPLFLEVKHPDSAEDWSGDARNASQVRRTVGMTYTGGTYQPTVGTSTRKEPLMQFHETWPTKTACVVRLPAAFYPFIVESGVLQEIADKAGAHIEISRMGKILVAASAFRFEASTREGTALAVSLLHSFLCNLGLCEKRFKVSKKIAARVVGKGGERISYLRAKSNCKIFVSDVEGDGEEFGVGGGDGQQYSMHHHQPHTPSSFPGRYPAGQQRMSWIILLGKPDVVAEAQRLMRPYLEDQQFGPRGVQPRAMNNPSMASWSSVDDEDGSLKFTSGVTAGSSTRATGTRSSYASDAEFVDVFGSSMTIDDTNAMAPTFASSTEEASSPVGRRNNMNPSGTIQQQHLQQFSPISKTVGASSSSDPPISGKTVPEDALFKAVQHSQWSTATELIARNEGIKFVAPSGTSVLHKAAERNAPVSIIVSLIQCGLDPNQTVARKGFISLHYAVQSNSAPSLALTLLKAGANVNHQDEQGFAPLHLAAQRNVAPKLVEALLQNGADLLLKDKTGATPLAIAKASRASPELLQLLERAS